MVKVRSFNKKPGAVLARRSGPFASPRSGSNSNCESYFGAEDAAELSAAAGAEAVADESVAAGADSGAGAEAAAAPESAAAGAVVSVFAQATSASAATRALRASFVFIELYPEKEKGKR
jgi:hypothetical protein